jgi:putative PIN family toxin of toxin-antitoxin system
MSKPQLRVVLDTNIYIAGDLSPNGSSAQAWRLARQRRFQLITSPYVVNEVGKVLRRLGREERDVIKRCKEIAHVADIVQPTTTLRVVRDPKDDAIVECAVDGKADMIVSLDKDLLTLKVYDNIPVLHVVDLLRILGK